MFFELVNGISSIAVKIVEAKYPKEFYDKSRSMTVFETIELVAKELARKNGTLFVAPVLDQLVDIHDLDFGDKVCFEVSAENE